MCRLFFSTALVRVQVFTHRSSPTQKAEWTGSSVYKGGDIAGVVPSGGSNAVEFEPRDRVAAFHEMVAPGGSFAEYAVGWDHATFPISKKTTFED